MHLSFITAACYLWLVPAYGQAMDKSDLFRIIHPSCDGFPIQQWLDESYQMALSLSSYVKKAKPPTSDNLAISYFETFLKLDPTASGVDSDDVVTLTNNVKNLFQYLRTGYLDPRNPRSKRPDLICSSDSYKAVKPSDQAYNDKGELATNNEGKPLTVQEAYGFSKQNLKGSFTRKPVIWHVGSPINYYILEDRNRFSRAKPCDASMLKNVDTQGTSYLPGPATRRAVDANPVILLCASSLQGPATLGSVAPRPVNDDETATQFIADINPKGGTMLHELFHYTSWVAGMPIHDSAGYTLSSIGAANTAMALDNADSYCFAAVGAFYSRRIPAENNLRVSYASGGCYYA